jgi:Kef-type K+ transport system membrane component KefB
MALLASVSGVAAIVGAFLAGMALAETASPRLHTLVHGAGELMVPFFLAAIGLQLDVRSMASGSSLAMSVAILIAAVNSKALGCGAAAWRMGWKDAARIGVGMVPRGEVGMVIAQIGMSRGAIGQEAYGVAVFMAVMTTVIAPPLLNIVYKDIASPPQLKPDEEPLHLG